MAQPSGLSVVARIQQDGCCAAARVSCGPNYSSPTPPRFGIAPPTGRWGGHRVSTGRFIFSVLIVVPPNICSRQLHCADGSWTTRQGRLVLQPPPSFHYLPSLLSLSIFISYLCLSLSLIFFGHKPQPWIV